MAVTKTINIDVDTKQAVKGLTDLKHEVSDLIDETNELNETNLLFKKELAELEQQFNKIPKSALSARKAIGTEMENLKVAIKDNNLALRDFRIKKQQKQKMIADLNTVHSKVLHNTEGFAKLGSVIGGAAVGMLKMAGASEETTHALEGTIHGVESVEHVTEGATKAQKLYQTQVKGNSIATKAAAVAQKAYALAVGTSTGGMKLFRLALISTGIGAIVVGLGLLIANFDKVSKFVSTAIEKFRDLGPVMKFLLAPITLMIAGFDAIKKGLQALGVIQTDAEKQAEKRAEAAKKRRKAEYEQYKKEQQQIQDTIDSTRRLSKVKEEAIDKEITLRKAAGKETRELEREKLKLELDTIKAVALARIEAAKKEKESGQDIFGFKQNLSYAAIIDANKKAFKLQVFDTETNKIKSDNYKKYAAERLSISRQIQDMENSLLEDGIDKELEINRVNFERLKADAKGNAQEKIDLRALYQKQEEEAVQDIKYKYQKIADDKQKVIDDKEESEAIALSDKLAEIKEANAALFRTGQENELLAVANKYDLLEAMAQGNAEALEDINIARLNAENDINLQYANESAANQKALDDKTLAEKQELQALILQGAKDTFTTISNLAQLFAGESEESQRKAFKIQKAANIANATIDTYASAVAAFRSLSGVPIVGVPLGIAAAAAAVTAGMLNVKSIGQQEFGGGGGAEPDVPSFDAGAAQAPSFNVVGDSSINQLASLQASPVQAYVVSGEVTTSQALDRNRVENATL